MPLIAVQSGKLFMVCFRAQSQQFCSIVISVLVIGCGVQSTVPPDVNQRVCRRQMRNIQIAVEQYLKEKGDLPLDSLADDAGEGGTHCWTSLVLANMYETRNLGQYRSDLSWDSPENTQLAGTLHVFSCLDDVGLKRRERSYFLLGELDLRLTDPKERYKLVEIHNSGIPRLSPVPESRRNELLSRVGVAVHRTE